MGYTIRQVTSQEDMKLVAKLRYQVYVDEMGRDQKYADHLKAEILEPYDRGADVLGAFENGRCVGTIRANCSTDSYVGSYPDFYRMGFLGSDHTGATSFVTKLIVDPQYRASTLTTRLVQQIYKRLILKGMLFVFIDTNDHLIDMYKRMGFVPYIGKVHHDEYGEVLPMILVMADDEHLKSVRSPLQRVSPEISEELGYDFYQHPRSQESVRSFEAAIQQLSRPACSKGCRNADCQMSRMFSRPLQGGLRLRTAA